MKRKIIMFVIFIIGIITIAACGKPDTANFSEEPTVTAATAAGELVLKAKAENEDGIIFWAVYNSTVTELSKDALIAGHDSLKSGQATHTLDTTVKLDADTSYSVFFVIQRGKAKSDVVRVEQKTNKNAVLGFSALALASGDVDGTLKVNAQTNGIGEIYFILVAENSAAPDAAQIVAGSNYGDVEVIASHHAAQITNYVISGLTPDVKYDGHFVVKDNDNYSATRKMSNFAKLTVVLEDKGEGTEDNPFRISTVRDLEQVGQGLYDVTGNEWEMTSHYILENDINLSEKYGSGKLNWPVLGSDSAGNRFAGVFDGAGHAIIGLYIGSNSEAGEQRALFGASEAAGVVKNLVIKNSYVYGSAGDETGDKKQGTGLLFGIHKGKIDNVQVYQSEVYATGTRVGGLVGRCYITGDITNSYVNAKVTGFGRVAGFAGVVDVDNNVNKAILFENLVFDGSVIGKSDYIGGIIGYARGMKVINAIVLGYIQGTTGTGGIVGFYQKRSDNNNVIASVENTIVYATIYGTGSNQMVGYTIGNKSAANSVVNEIDYLTFANNYYVDGSVIQGNGGGKDLSWSLDGTVVAKDSLVDSDWYHANMPTMDFDNIFEIKDDAQRATLIGTLDQGLLPELITPFVLLVDVKAGLNEKELIVSIAANKTSTIYYVVVASEMELTEAQIKDPSGIEAILHSGNGASINATYTMAEYNTTYYVYYVAESEGEDTIIDSASGNSKAMTELVVTGGLRAGNNNKEIVVNLSVNLTATIYYIIVAEEGEYTKEQIKNAVGVLASGNGAKFENTIHVMPAEGTTYYIYAYAEATDRQSVVMSGSGDSNSSQVINYGEGTVADPFIVRTVADLEAIGKGNYQIADGISKDFSFKAHYILANDIDLSVKYGEGKLDWPVLGLDASNSRLAGSLNGNGHAIIGLYIGSDSNAGLYRGLFAASENTAVVKNLVIKNSYIHGHDMDETNGNHGTGLLFGYFKGSIENVQVYDSEVYAAGTRVGGLVGRINDSGSITNSYVNAKITGFNRVGGFVGLIDTAAAIVLPVVLENLVFDGSVIGSDVQIGGIVGNARGIQLKNAIVSGYIQGKDAVGGVVGFYQRREGNNIAATIENTIVYATVFGIGSNQTVGYTIGNKSTSNSPTPQTLNNEKNYYVDGSSVFGNGKVGFVDGTQITKENLVSLEWYAENMASFDLTETFEIKDGAQRATLIGTLDEGLLAQLVVPLVVLPNVGPGADEKELSISITTNKEATIYYVVVASELGLTADQIKDPSGVDGILEFNSGDSISVSYLMAAYDTTYYVYYFAEIEGGQSVIGSVSGKSKVKTDLVITGTVRPGAENKELSVSLSTNLTATIYYIVVAEQGSYSIEDITTPVGVLGYGSQPSVDATFVMPTDGDIYYVYAYAEASDRESVIFTFEGMSNSAEVVHYGTGVVDDPYLIRTVADLEAIGTGDYTNAAAVKMAYTNKKYYALANDIDLSVKYGEGKADWTPLCPSSAKFQGSLDGSGYSIIGLYIGASSAPLYRGLFELIDPSGVVKNLTFKDSVVHDSGTTAGSNHATGLLVGYHKGTIENIRVYDSQVIGTGSRIGGLVGRVQDQGTVRNCYVNMIVSGIDRTGGIIGFTDSSDSITAPIILENLIFEGKVLGVKHSGGIVGYCRTAQLTNAIVIGYIKGNDGIGGIVGYYQRVAVKAELPNQKIENTIAYVTLETTNTANTNIGFTVGQRSTSNGGDDDTLYVGNNYYVAGSETNKAAGSNARTGVEITVDQVKDPAWYAEFMTSFDFDDIFEIKDDAQRPSLIGSLDNGLLSDITAPADPEAK